MSTEKPSQFVRLTYDDPGFLASDGLRLVPRAAIEIMETCPQAVAETLDHALNQGWIRPVAWVHQNDYLMDRLKQ